MIRTIGLDDSGRGFLSLPFHPGTTPQRTLPVHCFRGTRLSHGAVRAKDQRANRSQPDGDRGDPSSATRISFDESTYTCRCHGGRLCAEPAARHRSTVRAATRSCSVSTGQCSLPATLRKVTLRAERETQVLWPADPAAAPVQAVAVPFGHSCVLLQDELLQTVMLQEGV